VKFLKKLREKPEYIRKAILWTIVIVVGLIFAVWWIHDSKKGINEFRDRNIIQEIDLPDLEEQNY
jgi:hypothetical protein